MSDPTTTRLLDDLRLHLTAQLPERDADFIQMIELAHEAGEPISQRNFARLQQLHSTLQGAPPDER